MFNQYSDMIDKTNLMAMWQFDEGEGTTLTDVSTSGNTGTITMGTSAWANQGTWTAGGPIGAETDIKSKNIYLFILCFFENIIVVKMTPNRPP